MDYEEISQAIKNLRPERQEFDQSLEGRQALIEQDTSDTYAEMNALLFNHSHLSDEDYEETMRDLSGRLIDLDNRRSQLFVERTASYMANLETWKNRHGDWPSTTEVAW